MAWMTQWVCVYDITMMVVFSLLFIISLASLYVHTYQELDSIWKLL